MTPPVTCPACGAPLDRRSAVGESLRAAVRSVGRAVFTDHLTGLKNRRAFDHAIAAAVRDAVGTDRPVSLLFIDLDGLKRINDANGHVAGDEALRAFGRYLAGLFRPTDHVARYGGDEFVVILPGATGCEADAAADRISRSFTAAFARGEISLDASIGHATYPDDAATPETLVAVADAAMYFVKRRRRRAAAPRPAAPRPAATRTAALLPAASSPEVSFPQAVAAEERSR